MKYQNIPFSKKYSTKNIKYYRPIIISKENQKKA